MLECQEAWWKHPKLVLLPTLKNRGLSPMGVAPKMDAFPTQLPIRGCFFGTISEAPNREAWNLASIYSYIFCELISGADACWWSWVNINHWKKWWGEYPNSWTVLAMGCEQLGPPGPHESCHQHPPPSQVGPMIRAEPRSLGWCPTWEAAPRPLVIPWDLIGSNDWVTGTQESTIASGKSATFLQIFLEPTPVI